jgi:hypothetical protein
MCSGLTREEHFTQSWLMRGDFCRRLRQISAICAGAFSPSGVHRPVYPRTKKFLIFFRTSFRQFRRDPVNRRLFPKKQNHQHAGNPAKIMNKITGTDR